MDRLGDELVTRDRLGLTLAADQLRPLTTHTPGSRFVASVQATTKKLIESRL